MSLLLALALSSLAREPWVQVRSPHRCTIASAERVTFAQLHREQERLRGRCIALRGIWSGRALYRRAAGARAQRAEHDDATRGDRVGLYGSAAIERGARRPDSYVAIGLLMDCAALREGDDAVPGYCHNNLEGPFLAVTELHRRQWPTLGGLPYQ